MDLDEKITLSYNNETLSIPLINLIRIVLVKIMPLRLEFSQDSAGSSDINDFWKWMEKRVGLGKGKTVLI